jgi:hypothetical protein
MTNQPEEKRRLENLELNKETIQDLTEGESDLARGGVFDPAARAATGRVSTCPNSVGCT